MSTKTATVPNTATTPKIDVDPVTVDIIEGALKSIHDQMDATVFRSAISPVIREQHDQFPMITDPNGRMVVGQLGSYIDDFMQGYDKTVEPGDVIVTCDPYSVGGTISHINDWLVLLPIFHEDELIGWSSQFGHMMDSGGPLAGSLPTGARTIFGEGLQIPPIKLYSRGELNEDALELIVANVRVPEMNRADLMSLVAGCRTGERRVIELCERFGTGTYLATLQVLLDRTYEAVRKLVVDFLPEEPQSFEDWVDDDGLGNGPYKVKLTVWREGEHAFFDWSGTDTQAEGPINFFLHEGFFKMIIGIYLIQMFDPQIGFNDGFFPLIHVVVPHGSLLFPRRPAPLGCRTHTLMRVFDVLGGALGRKSPEAMVGASYGTSPMMMYSGWDSEGDFYYLMEILYGGVPGRPVGDGMDGHSVWALFENIPTEYLESNYPILIERYTSQIDTGGAGLHRGGNGIEKLYRYLEPGTISIHDDRSLLYPWGVAGGRAGGRSEKILKRADGTEERLPSKCDEVQVEPGDVLYYRTAGGGGWKDPLERDPATVETDVRRGLLSAEKAKSDYGVAVGDAAETERLREQIRSDRGEVGDFDFGPPLEELLAKAKEETGLEPPTPPKQLSWSPVESGDDALARVRAAAE